jgi:hypothetical protein
MYLDLHGLQAFFSFFSENNRYIFQCLYVPMLYVDKDIPLLTLFSRGASIAEKAGGTHGSGNTAELPIFCKQFRLPTLPAHEHDYGGVDCGGANCEARFAVADGETVHSGLPLGYRRDILPLFSRTCRLKVVAEQ